MAATLRQDLATPLFADVDLLGMLPYRGKIVSLMRKTEIVQAITSLRARGSDAHLWLPGGDVKTYGPELVSLGSWTSASDAVLTAQSDSGFTVETLAGDGFALGYKTITGLVLGNTYKVASSFVAVSSGTAVFRVGPDVGSAPGSLFSVPVGSGATSGNGTFVASATSLQIGIALGSELTKITASSISVREITSITPTITSGLTTGNYLESTGNTVATVDNPTGLVLDALGTVGVELVGTPITAAGTGWSASGDTVTATAANTGTIFLSSVASSTKKYKISFSASALVGATCYLSVDGSIPAATKRVSAAGSYSFIIAGNDTNNITFTRYEGGEFGVTLTNISVREVSGIHLTQTTTANKPVLRRGAYNYLLNSVLAGGTSGVEGSGAVAPTGWVFPANTGQVTFSGTSVRFVASTQRPFIGETTGSIGVGNYIFSTKVEAIAVAAQISDLVSASNGTGTITINSYKRNNVAALASENVALGDTISVLVSVTVAGTIQPRFGPGISGTVTADITLSSPQLETGSTASDYSPTTTAAGSNPDSGRYSWRFDSTDLLSATIPAGWETATIIDAAPTGAVASVQNVVGTHSIRGAMVTGVNLVTNGGFDSATGWGLSADATISGGTLNIATTTVSRAQSSIGLTIGKTYQGRIAFSNLSGARQCAIDNAGTGGGTAQYLLVDVANGTYTFSFSAAYSGDIRVMGVVGVGTFSVDDFSIYEINPVTHARILVKGTLTEAETNLYKSLANSFK